MSLSQVLIIPLWGPEGWSIVQMTRLGLNEEQGWAKVVPSVRTVLLVAIAAAAAIAVVGCYDSKTGRTEVGPGVNFKLPAFPETGANAVQVFTEMHYQPSYRVQEGPRILPPDDSVPVTGREHRYTSLEEYAGLEIPPRENAAYDHGATQKLYQTNCQVCHGPGLKGEGRILPFITTGPLPADLTADLTQDSSDGSLFGFITDGGRQGQAAILRGRTSSSPMPQFGKLLSENDRWALVQFLRASR